MLLQRLALRAALACALLACPFLGDAARAAPPMATNQLVDGTGAPMGTLANPFAVGTMPFQRAGDPFMLAATTTPQQYMYAQPARTNSYRGFNPCVNADVRIKTVVATAPVVTQPTGYAGVSLVTSATTQVSAATGTRFTSGPEILGSTLIPGGTLNPDGTENRIVSIMIVPRPGYSTASDIANLTCVFELGYGGGGGS